MILLWASFLFAGTLLVDDSGGVPYSSIQDAIDAASSGDTVLVRPGTYSENIILKDGVDVRGSVAKVTHIVGTGIRDVVMARSLTKCTFDGFSVKGSADGSSYAGIKIYGGSSEMSPVPGDISEDPLFDAAYPETFALSEESPCIDAGDPNPVYNDIDGTRNDMGAYGGPSGLTHPSRIPLLSGFIFTTIGKIPVSEITQIGPRAGLANVSTQTSHDFHIYKYTDAPFGGYLWISGQFGTNDTNVVYYQILAAKWSGNTLPNKGDFKQLTDPLTKIQYILNSDGTVTPKRVNLGPFTIGTRTGLYWRPTTGYWTFPDLKIIWNTTYFTNGRYDLMLRAFDDSLNPVSLPLFTLSRITIEIYNSPVEAKTISVQYDSGEEIPECGMINLGSANDNLKFVITTYHPEGFLRDYKLSALYGKNKSLGHITQDQYVGSNDSSPPYWDGVQNETFNSADAPPTQLKPWVSCAYQFRLQVWARTTDGYNHIKHKEFNDHYFISIGTQSTCIGDLNKDGVVDGKDLSDFADDFGNTDCLP